jgi:hypothetical protein
LETGLQDFQKLGYIPLRRTDLTINGNTAHSTGWWWYHAGAFYLGGSLYYRSSDGKLEYDPGRGSLGRAPCVTNGTGWCPNSEQDWIQIYNSKTFLTAGVGMVSQSFQIL